MRSLYPPLQPLFAGLLDVGDGHEVFVEECGNRKGIPVVFLHGGPGSGCKADHRQFFDARRYRIILLDQRGSGRSTPSGGVEHNTTQALVSDLELIRAHFGIERWVVFGGSWGATLALVYAETHPERVMGMALRGSFLAREQDVAWFFGGGASRLLPAQWHTFETTMDCIDSGDLAASMHAALFSSDKATVERAALAWEAWSGAVVMYSIDSIGEAGSGPVDVAIRKARIEMHYAVNRYFIDENQILEQIDCLPDVPVHIIHGARDITCPAESAWSLHRAISGSELEVIRTAGHLSGERAMTDALVRASDALAATLGK